MGSALRRRAGVIALVGVLASAWATGATNATTEPTPPVTPPSCDAPAIGADTDVSVMADVVCSAGFAVGVLAPIAPVSADGTTTTTPGSPPCDRVADCADVEIFHVTTSGWVHDGHHQRTCAEDLGVVFMSPYTAAEIVATCSDEVDPVPETVRPGDRGPAVMYVQIGLVALGFGEPVDGTYDDAMEGSVRRLQTVYGLDPNGVVGPETHALLGTGPIVESSPAPTTLTPTTLTPTTLTTTTLTTTTSTTTSTPVPTSIVPTTPPPSGMTPGTPRACTAAAASADTGLTVVVLHDCHGGWAIGMLDTTCPPTPEDPDAECESADVFHVTADGWVHDGTFYAYCAEAIADGAGMSIHTALHWSPVCGDAPVPERTNTKRGSSGPAVEQLQIALVALGYPLSVDGEFGPGTEHAVRDFQQRNGLDVDGIAGPDTQVALGL